MDTKQGPIPFAGRRVCGLALAAALAAAPCSAALGQAQGDNWFSRLFAPAATGSVPPAAPGQREWSGQPGASGHPLMTADAIRTAATNFRQCLEGLWPEASRRGISRAVFETQTAGLAPDLRIMDLLDAQPEFTKSVWDYLDTLVDDARIAAGRDMLARYRSAFDGIEKTYGVDRHIVAAIWGVETKYGALVGERPVLQSTATLACIGRRQDYFRSEFFAALEIVARGDIPAAALKGSWAGAFGPTQFMPTTFRRYAVDFDGDGRRDIVGSVPDALASTANNLKRDGWAAAQTWGYEVELPKGFDFMLADRARQMTLRQWETLGIRRPGGLRFARPDDRAYLLVPAGAQGPGFLMLQNFRVILKYNPAEAYALAIGHLADRLRGGAPFVQTWPRHERMLSQSERIEMQQHLARRGFEVGEADGIFGPKTRTAIRNFQTASGQIPDGFATASILDLLRSRR